MRLWSLHPKYLDAQGLVALWREGLLAQKVLRGLTRGYRHHPQLLRFRATRNPVGAIGAYLKAVAEEARERGYQFDTRRIYAPATRARLVVTRGQLRYELVHLKRKLWYRDRARYRQWQRQRQPAPHPLFTVVAGPVAPWEIVP